MWKRTFETAKIKIFGKNKIWIITTFWKSAKNHLKSSTSFEFITLYQWKTLDPKIVVFDSKGYHTMEYISAMESDNCVALIKYLEIHPKPWDIEYRGGWL